MATIENVSIKSLLNYEISRANEVTKKADTTVHNAVGSLIDGYGQNVPSCEVLTEITLDSDVSVVSINVTEEMKEKYEAFIIDFDLTFSEADYLYFGGDKNPKQFYYNKATNIGKPDDKISLGILIFKHPINNNYVNILGFGIVNLSDNKNHGYLSSNTWENLSGLAFSMYVSGVTMKKGGTVTMRGVRKIYAN